MRDATRFLMRATGRTRPLMSARDARDAWLQYRLAHGRKASAPLLTPPDANLKLSKDIDAPSYGLALAPADTGGANVCRWSTPACRAGCVSYAGMGRYDSVQEARRLKVGFLMDEPRAFLALLGHEVEKVAPARVRLNTFSDVDWLAVAPWLEGLGRFYDYTKCFTRRYPSDVWDLTYSASERTTDAQVLAALEVSRVAVVFATTRAQALPATYLGAPVIDGDKSDARWKDPAGVVVGLRAKGLLSRTSPMVVAVDIRGAA